MRWKSPPLPVRLVNGISLHRLQMLGWSLVLGLVFVAEVKSNLTIPTFSSTLLYLMGISSGGFLGFKLPEKQTVPATDSARGGK